ncbi:unnamed protein product [Euphydryas editha]|uniref:Uncharacterized protein n=1 Tax=Euphydryas editha TaxID=104508 RepID=A0AAU9VBZ6_EUPED|nr:unnamed protein product [Euphydryas editha]
MSPPTQKNLITPLQESKKQLLLEEVFNRDKKWDSNNYNSKKIDKLIGEMIALQNLPFNFVEGLGFRSIESNSYKRISTTI